MMMAIIHPIVALMIALFLPFIQESHRLLHVLLQPNVISSLALALIETKKNSGCKSKKAHRYRYLMIHMLRDGRDSPSDVCHNGT